MSDANELTDRLAAPFDAGEVKWKPATVSGSRALAICYVDARVVQDRLDEILTVAGWQDEYEVLSDGSVMCKLRVLLGDEWITKMDVGSKSEQPDEGDQMKAAFSDALKRTAVKFGVGRYLYRLPQQWVDWDAQKKRFAKQPTLPDWALPKKPGAAPAARPTPANTAAKLGRLPPADVERLCELLARKNFSAEALCKRYGVGCLDELSDENYAAAVKGLNEQPDRRQPAGAAQAS